MKDQRLQDFADGRGPAESTKDCIDCSHQHAADEADKLMASIKAVYAIVSTSLGGENGSEVEVDSQSETSDTPDCDEQFEDVQFYIGLLMNLVPSMEQAYGQILIEMEANKRTSVVETSIKKAVENPQTSASIHAEASTDSVRKVFNTSSKIVVDNPMYTHDKDWAKDLRVLFEKIWDERQASGGTRHRLLSPSLPSRSQQNRGSSPLPRPYEPEHMSQRLPLLSPTRMRAKSDQFGAQLTFLSSVPLEWENPGLLDEALQLVPLDLIHGEAKGESQLFQAQAASLGGASKAECGYQDCVIRALTR